MTPFAPVFLRHRGIVFDQSALFDARVPNNVHGNRKISEPRVHLIHDGLSKNSKARPLCCWRVTRPLPRQSSDWPRPVILLASVCDDICTFSCIHRGRVRPPPLPCFHLHPPFFFSHLRASNIFLKSIRKGSWQYNTFEKSSKREFHTARSDPP